ncbi:MAG TPA: hypothetical protein VN699_12370 [Pirellulales bacterium]|nr:hypothetical protein [Pirellulales bacterium]
MIYTPHEMINSRAARKGPKPRPAGKNADRDDLLICVKTGVKWAPVGHELSGVLAGPRRETLVFSEDFETRGRFALAPRGDINKSAEI